MAENPHSNGLNDLTKVVKTRTVLHLSIRDALNAHGPITSMTFSLAHNGVRIQRLYPSARVLTFILGSTRSRIGNNYRSGARQRIYFVPTRPSYHYKAQDSRNRGRTRPVVSTNPTVCQDERGRGFVRKGGRPESDRE